MLLKIRSNKQNLLSNITTRNYKIYPQSYTLDDYFKPKAAETFDDKKIVEPTLMNEKSKAEWVKQISMQENRTVDFFMFKQIDH